MDSSNLVTCLSVASSLKAMHVCSLDAHTQPKHGKQCTTGEDTRIQIKKPLQETISKSKRIRMKGTGRGWVLIYGSYG